MEGGRLRVHRFWAAVDPGVAVHPENLRAQMEGGVLFGLSSLLRERATFADGVIDQNNFYDYEVMRITDIPEVEVQIVESGAAPSGAGEIGVPMTGAAVANALRNLFPSARKVETDAFGSVGLGLAIDASRRPPTLVARRPNALRDVSDAFGPRGACLFAARPSKDNAKHNYGG